MLHPKLELLDSNLVNQIISEGIALLEAPGIRVHNQEALEILASAGAKVDFQAQIACIPESITRQALKTAPREFTLFDLKGNPAVHYFGDKIHFDPGSGGLTIIDSQTERPRLPLTNDLIKFIKLVETLPQIDAQSTAFICSDVVPEIGDLYRLYLALNYMNKPIITGAFRKDTWWTMKEMLSAVAGGDKALALKPTAVFDVCPSPPLLWGDNTCQNLIDCARFSIPAQLISMPLAGATAPITLAGAVVQHSAESLSGVVIHQLAGEGAPIVWGGSPAIFDMREGSTPMGAVETWMISSANVQIGKALGLPTHAYMGMSDAKIIDAQCGLESMGSNFVAALSGANIISGCGMLDFESCLSFEKLVIDAEMIGMVKRFVKGIEVRDDPIALSLMQKSGHKGNFLTLSHTRKWYREEQYMPSEVIDRTSFERWKSRGEKSTFERARDRAEKLITTYQSTQITDELRQELRMITLRAAQTFGMQSLPPLPQGE
ncbi:MAG: trimethylamine methyltransferase family protein [Anaerolineales bacterium]|nr:trimethylamine methyltransferase family protein [Anaerolineales bacterium]